MPTTHCFRPHTVTRSFIPCTHTICGRRTKRPRKQLFALQIVVSDQPAALKGIAAGQFSEQGTKCVGALQKEAASTLILSIYTYTHCLCVHRATARCGEGHLPGAVHPPANICPGSAARLQACRGTASPGHTLQPPDPGANSDQEENSNKKETVIVLGNFMTAHRSILSLLYNCLLAFTSGRRGLGQMRFRRKRMRNELSEDETE